MITSTSNPLAKRIRKLRSKKYRQSDGAYFIEGVRVFVSAVEAQEPIQTILYAPELLRSELALETIQNQRKAGTECVETTAKVFSSLSPREHPVGVGAVLATKWISLEELLIREKSIFVSLVNISEPGNLGTIIRTVDGVGGDGLILAGPGADPYHPTAVKASMGALFNVPLCQVESSDQLLVWAKDHGIQSVATSAKAPISFWDGSYDPPLIIFMGNEGDGLPADILASADQTVGIPMRGTASSLNVAVATGLILFEAARPS